MAATLTRREEGRLVDDRGPGLQQLLGAGDPVAPRSVSHLLDDHPLGHEAVPVGALVLESPSLDHLDLGIGRR
ncbi:MAG: hypothetical protein ACRDYZ_03735 [Acidimicrobiales bacterium]